MAFLKPEITAKQTWVEIDGSNGSTFVPFDILSKSQVNAVTETKYDVSELTLNEELGDYYDGRIHSVSLRIGHGARLSAAGYLDCTDWIVCDTPEAAQAELDDLYGDDDEDGDDDQHEDTDSLEDHGIELGSYES